MSLDPITREEHLMIGDYIEPVTRQEKILAGEDIDPVTREEWFLKEYRGGGGDIEVVSLSATENKTYTAPEGKAYSPVNVNVPIPEYHSDSLSVTENGTYTPGSGTDGYNEVNVNVQPTLAMKNISANGTYRASDDNADGYSSVSVNVPLPSNAYLLKSIENVNIATFTDGTDNFLKSLEVAIEPVQEGSGDPSPTNIRPISGWNECKVTVADDLENPTVSNVYTISLNGTRYGGKLDVVSGVLTVTHGYLKLTDTDYNWQSGSWAGGYRYYASNRITEALNNQTCQSSIYKKNTQLQEQGIAIDTAVNSNQIDVRTQHFSSLANWKTFLASNPVDVVYELATPLTIQLTPTIIKSLQGENNLFASTGEIELLQYWGR